jgi:hypothetical protein
MDLWPRFSIHRLQLLPEILTRGHISSVKKFPSGSRRADKEKQSELDDVRALPFAAVAANVSSQARAPETLISLVDLPNRYGL